jgi:hypothetical protein
MNDISLDPTCAQPARQPKTIATVALTAQQQRMKDCNSQASGMKGDARKQFMSACLSGGSAQTKGPNCTKGKPCGNTCIAANEVCHQQ